jgi:hypothetical protein
VQDVWSPNGPQQDTPPTPCLPLFPALSPISPRWFANDDDRRGGLRGTGNPAINRCRQTPDRLARRGHPVFAEWCLSAAWCCSLRSKLRSRDGNRSCSKMIKMGVLLTPRSTQPLRPALDLLRNRHCAVLLVVGCRLRCYYHCRQPATGPAHFTDAGQTVFFDVTGKSRDCDRCHPAGRPQLSAALLARLLV